MYRNRNRKLQNMNRYKMAEHIACEAKQLLKSHCFGTQKIV